MNLLTKEWEYLLTKDWESIKTSIIAVLSVISIEGLNLASVEVIQRIVIQGTIGVLTIIYLLRKIKQHRNKKSLD